MKSTVELFFENVSADSEAGQILLALWLDKGAEGVQEHPEGISLFYYLDEYVLLKDELAELIQLYKPTIKEHPWQNWNATWETNYPMVQVEDKVLVYAPFHTQLPPADIKILINPGMAFGTGHHSTTSLMIKLMLQQEFSGKKVIDMGTGTGVLAILASILGASEVLAVDNDMNAYESACKAVELNKIKNVACIYGDVSSITEKRADIILANITRNILLRD
ncbi:MAG: 50S ribosomal protein L11 methyltransferase, partial [Bacteroidetes bacterium HGW-Bacteroidetes-21]